MRWLGLKVLAVLFAALFGIGLVLYQQNFLKQSFQNTEKIGNSFRVLHTEFVVLQRIVLQASHFPYFDNDTVLDQIGTIRQRLDTLTKDPLLQSPAFAQTYSGLERARNRFEELTKTVYEFLTLNASLKNSTVYLPTLALKAYEIFDAHGRRDHRITLLLSKINATIFLAKNALDESFLKEIEGYREQLQKLKNGVVEEEKIRLLQALIGHLDLFLNIFPKFHGDLEEILDTSFRNELEDVIGRFQVESKRELRHINTVGDLFLLLYLLSILIVLYFIFRSEKENIELKRVRDQLQKSLVTDHLTGLENREAYLMRKKGMAHPALILVNIDRFKHINEFYGPRMGDRVLQRCAEILKEIVPMSLQAHIYRLGGDDFGILYEFRSRERTERVVREILKHFHERTFDIDGIDIDLSISIGASYAPRLFETADMALKSTKSSKRRRYTIYDDSLDMSEKISKNIRALKQIKRAISERDILPYFQPIIDLKSKTVAKYEALARIRTKSGEILEPAHFLEAAREAKRSGELTAAILQRTFEVAKDSELIFSVNISAGDILNILDRQNILDLLKRYRDCATRIVFEIVESEEIEDYETLGRFLDGVRAYGCRVAIDDFGSGYSNFEKLLQLQIDILKIDGSLIRNLDHDAHAELVVRTMVEFAASAGLETVAEYVHSEAIYRKVTQLGVDYAQGFFLGRPSPKLQHEKERE